MPPEEVLGLPLVEQASMPVNQGLPVAQGPVVATAIVCPRDKGKEAVDVEMAPTNLLLPPHDQDGAGTSAAVDPLALIQVGLEEELRH